MKGAHIGLSFAIAATLGLGTIVMMNRTDQSDLAAAEQLCEKWSEPKVFDRAMWQNLAKMTAAERKAFEEDNVVKTLPFELWGEEREGRIELYRAKLTVNGHIVAEIYDVQLRKGRNSVLSAAMPNHAQFSCLADRPSLARKVMLGY